MRLSKEELEDMQAWLPGEEQTIRYWLETGIPEGSKLEYPAERIEEIKKDMLQEWRKELEEMKQLHYSMWASYGSELCVEELLAKEEKLENKIKDLENGDIKGVSTK